MKHSSNPHLESMLRMQRERKRGGGSFWFVAMFVISLLLIGYLAGLSI